MGRRRTRKKKIRRRRTKSTKSQKAELLKQINNFVSRDDFHTWSNNELETTLISILKKIQLLKLEKNEKIKYFIDVIIDIGADQHNAKINKLYNEIADAYFANKSPKKKKKTPMKNDLALALDEQKECIKKKYARKRKKALRHRRRSGIRV